MLRLCLPGIYAAAGKGEKIILYQLKIIMKAQQADAADSTERRKGTCNAETLLKRGQYKRKQASTQEACF